MAADTWLTAPPSLSNSGNFPTRWPSASHTPTTPPSLNGDTMNSYPSPIIQVASVMERAPAHAPYSSRVCKDQPCILTVISSINVDVYALKNQHYHTLNSIYTNTLVTTCVNCGYQTTIIDVGATDDTDIPSPIGVRFPYPEGLGNPMTYEGSRTPRVARVDTSTHTMED